jgi:hypothetical protein
MRSWVENRKLAVSLAIVALVSLVVLSMFVRQAGTVAAQPVSIASVVSRDGDAMSYIVTYLLPFLAVNFKEVRDVLSLALVFFVIGILNVNSNMIYTNPALNLAGFHIFEIEDGVGKTSALICRRSFVKPGSELHAVSLGDYVLMEKQKNAPTTGS